MYFSNSTMQYKKGYLNFQISLSLALKKKTRRKNTETRDRKNKGQSQSVYWYYTPGYLLSYWTVGYFITYFNEINWLHSMFQIKLNHANRATRQKLFFSPLPIHVMQKAPIFRNHPHTHTNTNKNGIKKKNSCIGIWRF